MVEANKEDEEIKDLSGDKNTAQQVEEAPVDDPTAKKKEESALIEVNIKSKAASSSPMRVAMVINKTLLEEESSEKSGKYH